MRAYVLTGPGEGEVQDVPAICAEAKARGVRITAEVSPHHLTLTHDAPVRVIQSDTALTVPAGPVRKPPG